MNNVRKMENMDIKENLTVKAPNVLASAKFKYSQCQLDILFMMLLLVKENEYKYSFPVQNITRLTGRRWRSSELKQYAEPLLCKVLTIESTEKTEDQQWVKFSLFSKIGYKNGILYVDITEDALPLFLRTNKEFTYIELRSALMLNNKYSKRLYLLLARWRSIGEKSIDIDDLRDILGMRYEGNKLLYEKISDFKIAIENTCHHISAMTDIGVEVDWGKSARKTSFAKFRLLSKTLSPAIEANINYQESVEKGEFVHLCKVYGLSENQAEEMWSLNCNTDKLKAVISSIDEQIKKGTPITDLTAYLVSCFRNAGYLRDSNKGDNTFELLQNQRREAIENEKKLAIRTIKENVKAGAPMAAFKSTMDRLGITPDEIGAYD